MLVNKLINIYLTKRNYCLMSEISYNPSYDYQVSVILNQSVFGANSNVHDKAVIPYLNSEGFNNKISF